MNKDFRVSVDFFIHHKTKRVHKRAGDAGVISLLRLWAYAAKHRSDGLLEGMEPADIEAVADWSGEDGLFANTLQDIGFLDQTENGLALHGWRENNPWAADAAARTDKARFSRLSQVNLKEYERLKAKGISSVSRKDYENLANASGMPATASERPAPAPAPAPSPSPSPNESEGGEKQRSEIHALRDAIWRLHGFSKSQIETRKTKGSTEGIAELTRWVRLGLTLDEIRTRAMAIYDLAEQRGETIKHPWKYLAPAMSQLASQNQPPPEVEKLSGDDLWRFRLKTLQAGGAWSGLWGPRPDAACSTCLAPDDLLAEFGYLKKDEIS